MTANQHSRPFFYFATIATVLAFCVILLGAYTRLKDAGLGCPDWPGCYGQLTVPHTQAEIMQATKLYPAEPVEQVKAWAEMVHRYFAGSLGLLIFALTIWSLVRRARFNTQPIGVPLFLSLFVIFQAALGMWTVTWKLLPLVVMGHLLGGMTIFALLWWLVLKSSHCAAPVVNKTSNLKIAAVLGLIIVALQIFLGGWTTANYASLACGSEFPGCSGSLIPTMDLIRGFNFFAPIGQNYQGGLLDMPARIAIQMLHRYWGFITAIYVAILAIYLIAKNKARGLGWMMLLILVVQILLGILNVVLMLPLPIALAHNGVAALLLIVMVTLVYKAYAKK